MPGETLDACSALLSAARWPPQPSPPPSAVLLRRPPALKLHHQNPFPPRAFRQLRKWPLSEGLGKAFFAPVKRLNGCDADRAVEVQRGGNVSLFPQFLPVPPVSRQPRHFSHKARKCAFWAPPASDSLKLNQTSMPTTARIDRPVCTQTRGATRALAARHVKSFTDNQPYLGRHPPTCKIPHYSVI